MRGPAKLPDDVGIGINGLERRGLQDAAGHLLGPQARETKGGPVGVMLVGGRFGALTVQLKHTRGGDYANEPAQIVVVGDEIVGQRFQPGWERFIRGGLERDLIHRRHQRSPEHECPYAVHGGAGKGAIFLMCHPIGQTPARVSFLG